MARKTTVVTVEFSDNETRRFQVQQMKVKDGHVVLERIVRVASPLLGVLAANIGETDENKMVEGLGDLSSDAIQPAFDAFAENLLRNEGLVDWLTTKLRKYVQMETETEDLFVLMTDKNYDDIFGGEYFAEGTLVALSLKHNYGSFFEGAGGLAGLAKKFMTRTRSTSSSPKAAQSGSGESSSTSA